MKMRVRPAWFVVLGVVAAAAAPQSTQQVIQPAPIPHAVGQGIAPAFEGWYRNADGTYTLSFGYFNRNYQQTLDIPVGPNNRIEPGDADQGQPTHFLTRRQTGLFTVVVPKEFTAQQKVTWTITANGQTNSVPGHIRPEWEIDALKEVTSGNTPPTIKFDPAGKTAQGHGGITSHLSVAWPAPATLTVWATDDGIRKRESEGRSGPALGVNWSKFRGPGKVTFAEAAPKLGAAGKATTTATFTEPGEYTLRVLAWDSSGPQGTIMAGGFYCCWTNGYVKVNVTGQRQQSSR
jgi:hypothetical protein